jgi:hypothetical protein
MLDVLEYLKARVTYLQLVHNWLHVKMFESLESFFDLLIQDLCEVQWRLVKKKRHGGS